jgi:hypothetical protein
MAVGFSLLHNALIKVVTDAGGTLHRISVLISAFLRIANLPMTCLCPRTNGCRIWPSFIPQ